jgi:Cof subfamily protein (haloacid dehalogenase superfamily)
MVQAVFFDIDGTLVSFDTHAIPSSTLDAIATLKHRGIKVFIATGRALKQIGQLDGLEFDGYITMNGAYCVNARHELIHQSAIPMEDIDALIRYHEEIERFAVAFMTNAGMTVNYVDERVVALSDLVGLPVPPVESLREAARNEVLQMDVFIDREQEREIMRKVLVHCQASRWNPVFADINLRGCSKQSGIDHLLDHYNIPLNKTIAFGDGGNDIPMLRHVATGVAMGNASDEVKRTADYVTDTVDNHGIWNALKQLGIIG